jgi:hypothetical protein
MIRKLGLSEARSRVEPDKKQERITATNDSDVHRGFIEELSITIGY